MPPRPLTGSLWVKREGARTQDKTKKGPPSPLAAIFRGGRPLMNPPRKTATDGDGVRGKRAGGHPAPLALESAMKADNAELAEQAGVDSGRLPSKAK
jgi:hypothetical protein